MRKTSRRRSYKRNPALLRGVSIPPVQDMLYVGAGLIVPPIVTSYLLPYLPASIRGNKVGVYAVKAVSVVLPAMLVKKFVNPRAGNLMMLGGAASLLIDLVRDSGLLTNIGLSGAPSQPLLGFYPRRGAGLGKYPSLPSSTAPLMQARMTSNTPERLDPRSRF